METILSVIIPMYNAEAYIKETIDSALVGVDDRVEVVIVDDGSTDASYKVCEAYGDRRLHLIRQENCGAPAARNNGLRNAKGKYVIFFDADDFFAKDAPERILFEIQKEEHDCYIGNFYRYNGESSKIEYSDLAWIKTAFEYYMFTPSPNSKVFRRSTLVDNGLLFEKIRLAQDLNFYLKFLGVSRDIKVLDFPFFHYRYVEKSISHVTDDRILDIGKSVNLAIDYYDRHDAEKECYAYAYLTGVKHTNYQLEKLIYVDKADMIRQLYPKLKAIWDDYFKKAQIGKFSFRYLKKKWMDALIQYEYRLRVTRRLKYLEKAGKV